MSAEAGLAGDWIGTIKFNSFTEFSMQKTLGIQSFLILNRTARILLPLIIGLVVREVLAPFTGHPFDLELWLRLGYFVSQGKDPYSITPPIPNLSFPGAEFMTWIGYPPTWGFFQAGLYKIYTLIGINNRFLYYDLIKQPMIIADLVVGYLLYKIISEFKNEAAGIKAFSFWILCPFTIVISSVWGMFDQIILVFVLGSILFIQETQKSALMQALGFIFKVIPLIYLPVLALVQTSKERIVNYLAVAVGASIFFVLIPYLFFTHWSLGQLASVGVDVTHKIGSSSNYWIFFSFYSNHHPIPPWVFEILNPVSYLWIPAIALASLFCVVCIRKRENLTRNLSISLLFVTLVFFLTKSIVNEQYTIYFLGLGLVDYFLIGRKQRKILFHAIWITSFVFLTANNTYFARFLEPLSIHYQQLDIMFESGSLGDIRFDILLLSGLAFSAFSLAYLLSLYGEIRKIKSLPGVVVNNR
ncbi:MAG: hypothetical protein ACHQ1H_03555 [Nitrososphaerales archaeon]